MCINTYISKIFLSTYKWVSFTRYAADSVYAGVLATFCHTSLFLASKSNLVPSLCMYNVQEETRGHQVLCSITLDLILLRHRASRWTYSSLFWLKCVASKSRGSSCLFLSLPRTELCVVMPNILWRSKLSSSCLCSEHSYSLDHHPSIRPS